MLVIVLGPPRSGTTFMGRLLARLLQAKIVCEPHIAWKTGGFFSLYDEDLGDLSRVEKHMRAIFESSARHSLTQHVIEKSPVNVVRVSQIAKMFPDARFIWCSRAPDKVIESHQVRQKSGDSLKLEIVLRKYFAGGRGISDESEIHIPIFRQLKLSDLPAFVYYVLRMIRLKRIGKLPFGVKLRSFENYLSLYNMESYFERVVEESFKNMQWLLENHPDRTLLIDIDEKLDARGLVEKIGSFLGVDLTTSALTYAEAMISKKSRG